MEFNKLGAIYKPALLPVGHKKILRNSVTPMFSWQPGKRKIVQTRIRAMKQGIVDEMIPCFSCQFLKREGLSYGSILRREKQGLGSYCVFIQPYPFTRKIV